MAIASAIYQSLPFWAFGTLVALCTVTLGTAIIALVTFESLERSLVLDESWSA